MRNLYNQKYDLCIICFILNWKQNFWIYYDSWFSLLFFIFKLNRRLLTMNYFLNQHKIRWNAWAWKKNLMKRPFPFFCSYQQLILRQDEVGLKEELRWNRGIFGVKKSGISFYRLVSKCLFDPCNKKIKKLFQLDKLVQSFKKC
jgi:hypothetical protein